MTIVPDMQTAIELAGEATPIEQRALLEIGFAHLRPAEYRGGIYSSGGLVSDWDAFNRMLNTHAWVSAAMMITPKGWHTTAAREDRHSGSWLWTLRGGFGVEHRARGRTAAMALLGASLMVVERETENVG